MSRKICAIIFGNTDFGFRHFDFINSSLETLGKVDSVVSVALCLKEHNVIPPANKYRSLKKLYIFNTPDVPALYDRIAETSGVDILVKIHQPLNPVESKILSLFLEQLPSGNQWVYSTSHTEEDFMGFGLSAIPTERLDGLRYQSYRNHFDHREVAVPSIFFMLPDSYATEKKIADCFMKSRLLPPVETKFYLDTHLDYFLKNQPYATFSDKCLAEGAYGAIGNMLVELGGLDLNGLNILELGPGRVLVQQILLLLLGAGRVASVDIDETPLQFAPTFYVELLHFLARERVPIPELDAMSNIDRIRELLNIIAFGNNISFNPQRLDFRCPASAEQLPFDDASFDFAYSIAAFEHFRDPEKAVFELYRTLKPGARAYLHIDLKDHDPRFSKSAPLEFLKASPEE